jgi:histidyl-tRNA synthetase
LLEAVGVAMPSNAPDVYAVVPQASAMAVCAASCDALRQVGVKVQMHGAGADSWGGMKSQFKRADASGARFAVIFGEDELASGEATVKNLRDADAAQRRVALGDLPHMLRELLNA